MEHSAEAVTRLVFQLAVILTAAKVAGAVSERYLNMPAVLGELAAGIVIGPFALGGVDFPGIGALFENVTNSTEGSVVSLLPVPDNLWAIAQVGSIILLFTAGLETDLRQFLRYARPATMVAVGGILLPFGFGMVLTVLFGFADGFNDIKALFVGAVMTATSIGITVRVLGDLRRLNTPEGVTVLGAAVLDDVLGILILTIVVGLADTGEFSTSSVGLVALKTFGFWIAFTALGILFSEHISKFLHSFQTSGEALALALALAFLAAGLAESFGLAMIIGAFSIGLALSGTELALTLEKPLRAVYAVLVPVFFVVMGTLVDLTSLGDVWVFGLAITVSAVVGKIIGSGLPALASGFNRLGAWRVGVGMLPRGEVALIMAGIGISSGIINTDLYGVTIIMTIVTTALAPPILAVSFRREMDDPQSQSTTEES